MPEHPLHTRPFAHCIPPNACKYRALRAHFADEETKVQGGDGHNMAAGAEPVLRLSCVYSEARVLSALCGLGTELG